jgi:pimeloyl-ACP methyl ester carboxylesterase
MSDQLLQSRLAKAARQRGQRGDITIDGRVTAYWFYPALKRSAKNLVMIHGYRGNHHGLEAIAGALPGMNVYIADLPGFGRSEPLAAKHSIVEYAKWLDKFISGLGLGQKPHLLGHSFGSIVVSAYAARFDGIRSLILENPVSAPALKAPRAAASIATNAYFKLAELLPEQAGNRLLRGWPIVRGMSVVMTKSRDPELRGWIHRQHDENFSDFASRAVALEGYAASVSNCVADFSAEFKVPVLMLVAERDDITSIEQQRALFESLRVRPCQLVEFGSVGHLTHYEIPDQIADSIEEWVSEVDD